MTTYTDLNPSFMVHEYDALTMLPINMTTYTFDLDKANQDGGEPEWYVLHDYLSEYGMTDLSPNSFADLGSRVLADQDVANQYY